MNSFNLELHEVHSLAEPHSFSTLPLSFGVMGIKEAKLRQERNFHFLKQVHGIHLVEACSKTQEKALEGREEGDALWTAEQGVAISVKTADCLPILVSDETASFVLALHAGWRSLSSGIIRNSLDFIAKKQNFKPSSLRAFMGPAIGFDRFQVGPEVIETFRKEAKVLMEESLFATCVKDDRDDRSLFSLKRYAFLSLLAYGLKPERVSSLKACTFEEEEKWYSFRRTKSRDKCNWTWIKKD